MRPIRKFPFIRGTYYSGRITPSSGNSFWRKFESRIIRLMVLAALLLAVFQLRVITDPVDFYLRIAGDIESPAFKYENYFDPASQDVQTIELTFETYPADAPVQIWQEETLVGVIDDKLNKFRVKPGQVTLNASEISYPVAVEIVLHRNRYRLELNSNSKTFNVELKAPASS